MCCSPSPHSHSPNGETETLSQAQDRALIWEDRYKALYRWVKERHGSYYVDGIESLSSPRYRATD